MRALLVATLIHGLVPAFGEAIEAAVHYAKHGHLAHSVGEQDLGDLGREHGCGGSEHRCECCPSVAMALAPAVEIVSTVSVATEVSPCAAGRPAARSLEPPYRPPIA